MISGKTIGTTYERFIAECPHCTRHNIFSRVSDLGTTEPIDGKEVACEHCEQAFWISGDRINNAYESLLFDCDALLREKAYMSVVLTVCQAYEVFFCLGLRAKYVWLPFIAEAKDDDDELNQLEHALGSRLETWAFGHMRNAFLNTLLPRPGATTARGGIECLTHARPDLSGIEDGEVRRLAEAIQGTSINQLRNEVVHKRARRPTREEAHDAVHDAHSSIGCLGRLLGLQDDFSMFENLQALVRGNNDPT